MEVLLIVMILSYCFHETNSQVNLKELLNTLPNLSEFNRKINTKPLMVSAITSNQLTLFAPINSAFNSRREFVNQDMTELQIQYHMCYSLLNFEDIKQVAEPKPHYFYPVINSNAISSPPLWITRIQHQPGSYDYYINNAKILEGGRKVGDHQLLYIIDDILYPVGTINSAFDFLQSPQSSNNEDLSRQLSKFAEKIQQKQRRSLYADRNDYYTYFIPHDMAFGKVNDHLITDQVIDGHTIKHEYLFSRTLNESLQLRPSGDFGFPTLLNNQGVKIYLKIISENGELFAVSRTQQGNYNLPEGDVYAKILKANIAVANGVVHIIESFLIIIDKTIQQTIESYSTISSRFFQYSFSGIAQTQGYTGVLQNERDLTVFVPINIAFNMIPPDKAARIFNNNEEFMHMMRLHVVRGRKVSTNIVDNNTIITSLDQRPLNFLVLGEGGNKTYFVEGGGVRSRIIMPNVGSVNGFIHFIDAVLGIPFMNIFEKIRTSPELSITAQAIHIIRGDIKEIFNDRMNCTFFVPHNDAWKTLTSEDYNNLFQFRRAQLRKILQQHILPYTYLQVRTLTSPQKFRNLRNEIVEVSDKFGSQNFYVDDDYRYTYPFVGNPVFSGKFVRRNNQEAQIVFMDIGTTNGVIQVINGLLMDRNEIYTAGSHNTKVSLCTILSVLCLVIFFYFH